MKTKKKNATQVYVDNAIKEVLKEKAGVIIRDCNFENKIEPNPAAEVLAKAMLNQATANAQLAEAMNTLAENIKAPNTPALTINN